mgnify:CR=1 FL=1|tara:strand:+ start:4834 stop:5244 length:411 start_codon:yes stop_codon:yes gene_type:complete
MTLLNQINEDFMIAFKSKDLKKKNFLGVIRGEVETAKGKGIDPNDEYVLKVIKKMEKSLIEIGSVDSKIELDYLSKYIPKLMSEYEIRRNIAFHLITCKDEMKNIRGIMQLFNNKFKGKVDNGLVSKIAISSLKNT